MNKPIDALRALIRDIVATSEGGCIGRSLSASALVYTLYRNILRVSPNEPDFINRDRIVFSTGYCTPLIYSILHLCGYDITKDDLRKFRSYKSATPAFAQIQSCGVDCSTGMFGQGIANAVGLAIAEKQLSSKFNKPGLNVIDHYTYCVCGEECLMEGISYEAMNIAGELNLDKLIVLYDCNKMIEQGSTDKVFNENLKLRMQACGWDVFTVDSTNDIVRITNVIEDAKKSSRPSLVIVPSLIGDGLSCSGEAKAFDYTLSKHDAISFRELNNLPSELFNLPQEYYNQYREVAENGDKMVNEYSEMLYRYKKSYKKDYEMFINYVESNFKIDCKPNFLIQKQVFSGVDLGHEAINELYNFAPNILCCSSNLRNSTKMYLENSDYFSTLKPKGDNLECGVREFASSAICTGIALHGGIYPVCSSFLIFADYMKSAIRMSAQMNAKMLYVFTHDSLLIGEYGAVYQPVEQLDMLRTIPNLNVLRPCCKSEVEYAFKNAYNYDGTTVIILSKGNLANLVLNEKDMTSGVYIACPVEEPVVNLFASGEDVNLAIEVRDELLKKGKSANIISVLRMTNFLSDIPKAKVNCVIECSTAFTLMPLLGENGILIRNSIFSNCCNGEKLYSDAGFNAKLIVEEILKRC